ncbi:hypothetical protein JCM8097_004222 [Rhodosporidiobolus ruineniae]
MLDRLPLELVQHIVFLTLPSSFSFTKYRERQDPLLALCLTSRALCEVAQPVLFESVNLENDKAVVSFLEVVEVSEVLGKCTRALRIEGDPETWHEDGPVVLGRLCKPCKSVTEIVVFQGIVDLCCLEAFPKYSAISLPTLKAFELQAVAVSCDILDLAYSGDSQAGFLQPRLLHDCGRGSPNELAEPTMTSELRTLRLNPFAGESSIMLPALDFPTVDAKHWDLTVDVVNVLDDRSAVPKLSSCVFFPTAFDSHSFQASAPSCSILQNFEALCASRNIELIFEDLPHPYYDSFISPEFVKRCKAAKAKEAAD